MIPPDPANHGIPEPSTTDTHSTAPHPVEANLHDDTSHDDEIMANPVIDIPAELLDALRSANRVAVLTGAGVSAESGIPTFRDALTGMWAKHRPEDLATPEAFAANPEHVAQWYDERRLMCRACAPNAGHVAIAALEEHVTSTDGAFTLITQNVDRLHQRAGSRAVLELHGSIFEWRCIGCGEIKVEEGDAFTAHPPTCESCHGHRRPNVVWFGELLNEQTLNAADDAADTCDLFFTIGTSSVVYPAAGLIDIALGNSRVVEVNIDETSFSRRVDWHLRGPSAAVLPQLLERLQAESG